MFVELSMSDHLEKTTRWMAILIVLTFTAFYLGCRGSLPVFTSEPASAEVVGANSRVEKAAIAGSSSQTEKLVLQFGDILTLSSLDSGEVRMFRIEKDGTVNPPSVGTFVAAGKTIGELHNEFVKNDPRYRNFALIYCSCLFVVSVVGEVKSPGAMPYLGRTTVSQAIRAAGGFTQKANNRTVHLIRFNGRSETVHLHLTSPDADHDPAVFPGDIIEVKRGGIFAG